jgi:hypothetical protein
VSEQRHDFTLGEAIDLAMQQAQRHPLVWIEDGVFIVRDEKAPGLRYDFECKSALDALSWAAHLAAKAWITKEHVEQFTALAHDTFKARRK